MHICRSWQGRGGFPAKGPGVKIQAKRKVAGAGFRGKRRKKLRSRGSGWTERYMLLLRYRFLVLVALEVEEHKI